MPFHKEGAYDGFDSLKEVREHYSRCRTLKYFILSDKCIAQDSIPCRVCGKVITVKNGNRCQYARWLDKIVAMCYECAWKSLFCEVFGTKCKMRGPLL